jgi:hypothetical protein
MASGEKFERHRQGGAAEHKREIALASSAYVECERAKLRGSFVLAISDQPGRRVGAADTTNVTNLLRDGALLF